MQSSSKGWLFDKLQLNPITLENLVTTDVGQFRADSDFYDKAIVGLLKAKKISHIIGARLTHALQQAIVDQCKCKQFEIGL